MWVDHWQQMPSGQTIRLRAERQASTAARVWMRAAKRADAPAVDAFVRRLSPDTRRKRFFGPVVELSPEQLLRLTSCLSDQDVSLLALDAQREIIGMAQCVATGDAEAEFALVVADEWQRQGIGTALCKALFQHAREHRLARLGGFVLTDNRAMLGFAAKLGFSMFRDTDATITRIVMPLADPLSLA